MFYQKMLIGSVPYFLSVGNISEQGFDTHYHYETEICLCIDGNCTIICDKERITLSQGDFAVIFPMSAHSVVKEENSFCNSMVLEFGQAFLGRFYEFFTKYNSSSYVIRKNDFKDKKEYNDLFDIAVDTAKLKEENNALDDLLIKSNLYKISALMIVLLKTSSSQEPFFNKTKNISNIEKALEMIYNRYGEQLNIDTVSSVCGYSKSNFCRIFKSVTGDTFHSVLTRHRIEIACYLLKENNLTIEEISQETGFSDLKNFCRVFKNTMGVSAGEYRKSVV